MKLVIYTFKQQIALGRHNAIQNYIVLIYNKKILLKFIHKMF